jgi:hypothetical protein
MAIEDGNTILVEVADDEQRLQRVGRVGTVVRGTAETLEEALRRVKPVIAAVVSQVHDLASPPDKVGLEFGVKLTAEAGVVIAKASTEANFKLSLEWMVDSRKSENGAPRKSENGCRPTSENG